MIQKTDILALKLIKGIGDKSLLNLIASELTITDLLSSSEELLGKFIKGSGKKTAIPDFLQNYEHYQYHSEELQNQLNEQSIHLVSFVDENYPKLYKTLKKPPVFLYAKGNLDLLNYKNNIAVVGTRDCSEEGRKIARSTARFFAERDFNIVSGLALGIDTAGHKGTLDVNGKTTAIVVDVKDIFPKENIKLVDEILENDGLVFSENEPGVFPNRGLFVNRDRLQSGLSQGVFPIETDIKGGTMHTVGFAQEQNRLLFCPDISKVHYERGFSKIRGIEKLLNENIAKPYTSNTYNEILVSLENKRKELLRTNEQENLTLGL